MAAYQIAPSGLAMPRPAMSGGEPWTGSNTYLWHCAYMTALCSKEMMAVGVRVLTLAQRLGHLQSLASRRFVGDDRNEKHMHTRRVLVSMAGVCALLVMPACGDGSTGDARPSPSASASASSTYTSKSFAVPLTITVPSSLGPRPTKDTRTFLTWVMSGKVRFLLPAVVYRPGHGKTPPPSTYKSYVAYLHQLSAHHATWRDEATATVGGHPATLLTGTTSEPLDGSLGCPTAEADPGEGCMGLQPEFEMRVAVIDTPGRPLVAWTTIDITQGDFAEGESPPAAIARFEGMLRTLRFR